MPTKNFQRVAALAMISSMIFLSGCFDLGEYKDEEEYYASFGDVGLISQSGIPTYYSIEDYFFNKDSVNDFAGDIVPAGEYIYLTFRANGAFQLDSLALYVYTERGENIHYSIFISQSLPVNIRTYDAPAFEQETDEEGNPLFNQDGTPVMKEIEYGDPSVENAICVGTFYAKENKWSSFTADSWKTPSSESSKKIDVPKGDYILVRFENNSGIGRDAAYGRVSFRTTNLLVRSSDVLPG